MDLPVIQQVKAALQQGTALLVERQKLIKIADPSANGWSVVAKYTEDELAEDSDDEKRLEKAKKAAQRKAGLKMCKRPPSSTKASASPYNIRYVTALPYSNFSVPYLVLHLHQQSTGSPSRRCLGGNLQRAIDPCFACS